MSGTLVSNTGPLVALGLVGRLDVLGSLFAEVVVPEEIHQELLWKGASGPGVGAYLQSDFIRVHVTSVTPDPLLCAVLDAGEASVVRAGMELSADWVLIDDRKARRVAREIYGLNVIGTAGLLVLGKNAGFVGNVGPILERMRANGYWIHERIVRAAMQSAGES